MKFSMNIILTKLDVYENQCNSSIKFHLDYRYQMTIKISALLNVKNFNHKKDFKKVYSHTQTNVYLTK